MKLPIDANSKKRDHVKQLHIELPYELVERMVDVGGVRRGNATEWIIDAIERKLTSIETGGGDE